MVHFHAKAATGEKPRCTCIQAPCAAHELHMCQVHAHDAPKTPGTSGGRPFAGEPSAPPAHVQKPYSLIFTQSGCSSMSGHSNSCIQALCAAHGLHMG